MALSSINTHGLLNYWPEYAGVNVWHWNQITGAGVQANLADIGQDVWVQPERDTVAEGIARALAVMRNTLNFYPVPVWTSERVPLSTLYPYDLAFVPLNNRYIQAIGRRATSLIQSGATVVYSDSDGDGIEETATITVTVTAGMPSDEVCVFFRVADGANAAADERWQIIPLRVSISGTTATITGHRAQFAQPSLWSMPYRAPNYNRSSKNAGDTTHAADFVTQVDVYRVYADATDAVQLVSYTGEPVTALAEIDDPEDGFIRLMPESNRYYPALRVWYRAGYPLDAYGRPEYALLTATMRLASCEMSGEGLVLDSSRLPLIQKDLEIIGLRDNPLEQSPLGVRNGQVAAWKTIAAYARPNGMAR